VAVQQTAVSELNVRIWDGTVPLMHEQFMNEAVA